MDRLPIEQDPARAAAKAALASPELAAGLASGVPALVLAVDPPRLVLANAAAVALFDARDEETLALRVAAGAEPAFARLLQLNKSLRPGAPPRRERLACDTPEGFASFSLQRVPGAPPLLVAVAPDARGPEMPQPQPRPTSARLQTETPAPQPVLPSPAAVPQQSPAVAALSATDTAQDVAADLARRFDQAAFIRILWQTDSDGRIVTLSGPLAEILRVDESRLLGQRLADVARESGADPELRLQEAIARRETWSHLELAWPVQGAEAAVMIVLGGSPVRRGDSFEGYRGFGVIHLQKVVPYAREAEGHAAEAVQDSAPSRVEVAADAAEEPAAVAPLAETPAAALAPDSAADDAAALEAAAPAATPPALPDPVANTVTNVVQLRPNRVGSSMTELSPSERNAFREIARALGARRDSMDDPPERPAKTSEPTRSPVEPEAAAVEPAPAEPLSAGPAIPANPRVRDLIEIASRARSLAEDLGRDEPPVATDVVQEAIDLVLETGDAPSPEADDAVPIAGGDDAQIEAEEAGISTVRADPVDAVLTQEVRSLIDRLPIGVLISQLEIPIFLNRTLLELLGYESADEFHDAGGLDHMFRGRSPESLSEAAAGGAIPLVTQSGEVIAVEARVQTVSWQGDPATMICLRPSREAETVARLRATEQDLRGRDAEIRELHAILDTATDGVALIDDEGRILSLNRAAQALFGYETNELVGEPFTTLLVRESHQAANDYLTGLRSSGVASVMNDGRDVMGRARQGGAIPLFLTLGRVTAGGSNKFCMVLRDMTSWKKAERELNEARKQAERASALKSDFLAKVSHEIRTPLNAILGFAEVIMDERFGPVGNERYKDYLKDIHASGSHVMSLVNDLLDLSKIEAGRLDLTFGAVDANRIVSECVSLMQPQAARDRVIIRVSLAQRLPNIVADERSLRQIVLNLLSNGVKFNEPGGQVIVSTALTDAGHAVIRIRDTGIGMSETETQLAMEPFRQLATARVSGGTGLGLPLTKALVEANRASFTIKSKKKEGTLIEVAFPPTRVLAE